MVTPLQSKQGAGDDTTSVTVSFDSPTTAGTLLVAIVGQSWALGGTPGVTMPSGWIASPEGMVQSQSPPFVGTAIGIWYYPNNPGGITSVTASDTSSPNNPGIGMQLVEFSGTLSSPLDVSASSSLSGSSTTSPSVMTPARGTPDDLVIGAFSSPNAPTYTAGSGFSAVQASMFYHAANGGGVIFGEWAQVSGSAAVSVGATISSATSAAVVAVCFSPRSARNVSVNVPASASLAVSQSLARSMALSVTPAAVVFPGHVFNRASSLSVTPNATVARMLAASRTPIASTGTPQATVTRHVVAMRSALANVGTVAATVGFVRGAVRAASVSIAVSVAIARHLVTRRSVRVAVLTVARVRARPIPPFIVAIPVRSVIPPTEPSEGERVP